VRYELFPRVSDAFRAKRLNGFQLKIREGNRSSGRYMVWFMLSFKVNNVGPQEEVGRVKIQVYADSKLGGSERLSAYVTRSVSSELERYNAFITRVEIHINAEKSRSHDSGNLRCKMEARLKGRPPVAVTQEADELDQAIKGAVEKLNHSIQHTIGRLRDRRDRKNDLPTEPNL
jgi:ribosome-associated translation inhibitor RaiA